jgi:predicted RNA-binding protein (virulence factor B family)
MADKSCNDAVMRLKQGDVISFDCAYDHRRNAKRYFVSIICQRNRKILAYTVISKDTPKVSEYYCPVAQNMEVHGMRLLLQRLGQIPEFRENVRGYVHDNDVKRENLIKNLHWDLKGHLDPLVMH